ncbi:hypothetical protein JHJ06_23070, partial [Escherichia coli]|nr:hypothetical protein [Escherichia coli]
MKKAVINVDKTNPLPVLTDSVTRVSIQCTAKDENGAGIEVNILDLIQDHDTAEVKVNRPGFPGECFICELRLPDHRFRWKHNKLFLLLPVGYGPAFPAIVDCYT